MNISRLPYPLVGIILLALIYNFLNTIFKSDIKRFSHDRLYIDYSSYKKKDVKGKTQGGPITFMPPQMRQEFRQVMEGRVEDAVDSYNSYMAKAFAGRPEDPGPAPRSDPLFEEVMTLARRQPDGIGQARLFFAKGNYAAAVQEYTGILNVIPENDLQNRIQILNSLAECAFYQNRKDGYVENKVKSLQLTSRMLDLLKSVYANTTNDSPLWMPTEEATQNLLKVRVHALQTMKGREKEDAIRRAEFDLEVSRSFQG